MKRETNINNDYIIDNLYENNISQLFIKVCIKETREYLKCLDSHTIENKSKCKEYLKKFIECNDSTIYNKNKQK